MVGADAGSFGRFYAQNLFEVLEQQKFVGYRAIGRVTLPDIVVVETHRAEIDRSVGLPDDLASAFLLSVVPMAAEEGAGSRRAGVQIVVEEDAAAGQKRQERNQD